MVWSEYEHVLVFLCMWSLCFLNVQTEKLVPALLLYFPERAIFQSKSGKGSPCRNWSDWSESVILGWLHLVECSLFCLRCISQQAYFPGFFKSSVSPLVPGTEADRWSYRSGDEVAPGSFSEFLVDLSSCSTAGRVNLKMHAGHDWLFLPVLFIMPIWW